MYLVIAFAQSPIRGLFTPILGGRYMAWRKALWDKIGRHAKQYESRMKSEVINGPLISVQFGKVRA